jgi:N-dimethylarginine dimethylaminohydrolase
VHTVISPVHVYSEFQPLEEVIVGRVYPPEAFLAVDDPELRDMLQRIASETEEDFQSLIRILEQAGVTVRRPDILHDLYDLSGKTSAPKAVDIGVWRTPFPNPPVFPRDLVLTYGSKIVSVYSRSPNRWLETQAFHDIFLDYYSRGAEWVSMPPPRLAPDASSYRDYEGRAILFHAAALVRCGRDLFHTLPAADLPLAKGTGLGLRWLKEVLGPNVRFHRLGRHGHMDSKISLLKPGLLMSWLPREELPGPLQSWHCISIGNKAPLPDEFVRLRERRFFKDYVKTWLHEWIGYVDETYFDVNVLSLGPDRVLMNGFNADLFAQVRKHGIEPIPVEFRHRIFWDGALHCVTLDVRRSGPCEDYFPALGKTPAP